MKALVIRNDSQPPALSVEEVPAPEPARGEIRVTVRATALNRADLLQIKGLYPPPAGTRGDIPGLEFAGEVETPDTNGNGPGVGTRVMGLLPGEGFAEKVVLPTALAIPIPTPLTFEQAAAIPEVFLTAYDALFRQLQLQAGERLLIHAVGSGVGTAALQLAKLAGAHVAGTAGSAAKLLAAADLGLDLGIDYHQQAFRTALSVAPFAGEVDAVLDLVGARHWSDNLHALAPLGRLIVVGLVSGARVETDLGLILRKRLRILGTALRSRTPAEKTLLTAEFASRLLPLFESGRLRPIVDRVFDWSEIETALQHLAGNQNFGKVVLRVG